MLNRFIDHSKLLYGWFKRNHIALYIIGVLLTVLIIISFIRANTHTIPVRNVVAPLEIPNNFPPITDTLTQSPTQAEEKTIPKLIFGIGSEADGAIKTRFAQEAPVQMLTSWYNGPSDLTWITGWKNDLIPNLYAQGYVLHLITFTEKPEGPVNTPYGAACGREYPVSTRIRDDMRQLAQTFKGSGKLYVTLFTEFQTYPCEDNKWQGNENYYNTLKDQYRAIKDIFHQYAPNAQVGISWGGWQSRWDDSGGGGGISLFPHFADIMNESDIIAFQAMESGRNIEDISRMTKILGAYKKPVILSHYKPDNGSQDTFNTDMRAVLTDDYLRDLTNHGLVAMSFMDNINMDSDESIFQFIRQAVIRYTNN